VSQPRRLTDSDGLVPMTQEEFRLITGLIRHHCGIAFGDDMRYLVQRRLSPRLVELNYGDFTEYYHHLVYHPNRQLEFEEVVERITTNETYFFREAYQLSAFSEEILPEMARRKRESRRLTLWSAGCSTGEEVYSLAMLILESRLFEGWEVRVFGSDISRRVLAAARKGVYGHSSFRATDERFLGRYFVPVPSQGGSARGIPGGAGALGHGPLPAGAPGVHGGSATASFSGQTSGAWSPAGQLIFGGGAGGGGGAGPGPGGGGAGAASGGTTAGPAGGAPGAAGTVPLPGVSSARYQICDQVRSLVSFGQINLVDPDHLALVAEVDIIFCRNVLIYFDTPERRRVIDALYRKLAPGGYLLLGHSESLINLSTAFELVHLKNDMVYRKAQSRHDAPAAASAQGPSQGNGQGQGQGPGGGPGSPEGWPR
jgi:chemotaxis methyl-accepting protein methylase